MAKTKKKEKSTYIRMSRHPLYFVNHSKRQELSDFVIEYRRIAQLYLDYLWVNGIKLSTKTRTFHFDSRTHLDCPGQLSTVGIDEHLNLQSFLTARVRKCCITQVLGIIKGDVEKQRKRYFVSN